MFAMASAVTARLPPINERYLATKREKLGHRFPG
jgi:GTP cyclohydrolase II